jgi:hypothetical protein
VYFLLIAAPDQGETIIVRPREGSCSVFGIYVFIHNAHVSLHFFDGMNYLVADGENSLRQGRVR